MTRTQETAVAAISYGLIAALVAVVLIVVLNVTGVDIENIFSTTGNTLASAMIPNSNLTSEQQSEIVNAAAEIAAGTASLACLQAMNNAANASSMASNGATCLGPGLNITPPQEPIKEFFNTNNYPDFAYPDGQIYASGIWNTKNATNINAPGVWFYNDGFVMNSDNWTTCSNPNGYAFVYSPSTTMTTQGTLTSCTGGANAGPSNVYPSGASKSAPMGYMAAWTW